MDDWDSINWDEKVDNIIKKQNQQQQTQNTTSTNQIQFKSEDDGNYFEANQEKKKQERERADKQKNSGTSKHSKQKDDFIQPHSNKDLRRIRELARSSATFHNLIYETFGQFERLLMTHKVDLTHEGIVELLIIDAALLEVPFHAHNQLLLSEISKIDSFWSQLINFLQEFLSTKHQDMKFLLTVDMNGFFDNIESLLHNLIVDNLFNSQMENVFKEIVNVMETFPDNKWSCGGRLRSIQEQYERNRDVFKIYDVSFIKRSCDKMIINKFFLTRFTHGSITSLQVHKISTKIL